MKTSKYKELDKSLLSAIKGGKRKFEDIFSRVNTREFAISESIVGTRLQSLKKNNKIQYIRAEGGWVIASGVLG